MSFNRVAFQNCFQKHSKGGSLTRVRAETTWNHLQKFSKEKRMILEPAKMTSRQVMRYVEYRVESGAGARTIQNEVSHIRRALRGGGQMIRVEDLRDKTNNWSGSRLRVPQGSRIGGKEPADTGLIQRVERQDIKRVFELQSALGLRVREAIQAGPMLNIMRTEIEKAQAEERGAFVRIVKGTKGGRGRSVWVPPSELQKVKDVVIKCLDGRLKNGDLVDSKNLKSAARACERSARGAGFQTHGLRRAWAVEQFHRYASEGLGRDEALKLLSQDLGHGDGRGRWVWNNYLRGAV